MKASVLALLAISAPATACPWHGDIFGDEPGGYVVEPAAGSPAGQQADRPAPSREELMAKQRELFLARYPQLAAGAGDRPVPAPAPSAPASGD